MTHFRESSQDERIKRRLRLIAYQKYYDSIKSDHQSCLTERALLVAKVFSNIYTNLKNILLVGGGILFGSSFLMMIILCLAPNTEPSLLWLIILGFGITFSIIGSMMPNNHDGNITRFLEVICLEVFQYWTRELQKYVSR